jgi:uncharacterized protein involved in exopolysaccharide biosynthesis
MRRHWWRCTFATLLGGIAALAIAQHMPRRFKSTAIINVQSSYFRNPLVSDLVPEVTEAAEVNAQRQSLFRLALDDDFINSLGEDFGYFQSPRQSPIRPEERAELLKRIEYISLNATTFQVSAPGRTGHAAATMLEKILAQIRQTFVVERYTALSRARAAIAAQVEFLARALRELGGTGGKYQPEYLESELERIDERLATLRQRYTESHPEIFKLKGEGRVLSGALERARRRQASRDESLGAFVSPSSKQPVQDIYNDLLKKLSHLTIVLSMEKEGDSVSYLTILDNPSVPLAPVAPKIPVFILGGMVVGFMLGVFGAARFEYKHREDLAPIDGALALDVPLLGELPRLEDGVARALTDKGFLQSAALPEA